MESHDISSPPLPAIYHKALMAYHAYTAKGGEGENFLVFWSLIDSEDDIEDASTELTDSSLDILRGIVVLRDQVVKTRYTHVPLVDVVKILKQIQEKSIFPESSDYWEGVISSMCPSAPDEQTISLNEISEAVLSFLKNLSTGDGISSSHASDVHNAELENFKQYINTTLDKLREEMGIETRELREEIDQIRSVESLKAVSSLPTTTQSTPRNHPVPKLPFSAPRRPSTDAGFRICCSSDIASNCLIN
jgi:hypothetical protein